MDRPILISTPLVRPTIDGFKTVTRRLRGLEVVNENPGDWHFAWADALGGSGLDDKGRRIALFTQDDVNWTPISCPYGKAGDQLWVRETVVPLTNGYGYKADGLIRCGKIPGTNRYYVPRMRWTPSIHMPRDASRITLELLDISLERAHDITEADAKMEGVDRGILRDGPNTEKGQFHLEMTCKGGPIGNYRDGFIFTWMTLNGRESWDKNPWIWRLFFKLLKCTTP
jgi:hypothetical protein